ncbi:MAG: elongation factor P [bacterium]|nr:elongation factor P [bacterium]
MSISPSDFRNGMVIDKQNQLLQVMEFQHIKPGKGPAFVRVKFKNLRSGAIFEEKLRPEEKLDEVRVENRKMAYLYNDGDDLVLMDNESYDQIHLPRLVLGKQAELLIENQEITVAMNGEEAISAELPLAVVREVTFSEPGVKGDTSGAASKPATVEGGATVNVPLFVNEGDKIKIDTKTFAYIERARD